MDRKYKFLFVLLIMVLTACSVAEVTDEPIPGETAATDIQDPAEDYPVDYPVETEVEDSTEGYPVETESTAVDLETAAVHVINALAEKDMTRLANFVHPEMGVRFSPYGFVREEHQVFMPNELPALVRSEEVYTWGAYDGTGDPIDLIFDDYYQEFVYSSDFANPEQMGVNERIGQGNTINNIGEFYPGSSFVEYHFSGFEEQYEGMDWESLRLVFVQEDGTWWLVGIVHDEWTI
jgi:hypothetical protein